jgi:hypothetical protein
MKKILPLLALICLNCSNPIKNGDTDSFLVEIPYEYINQKIIIPVEINNKEYRFCFDTGSRTVIRSKIKSEILSTVQSEVGDWFITDGNNQSHLMSSILIDSLSIGGIHFKNVEALTDTIHHEVWQCFDFDGYIGSELLQEYIVQIDSTDNKIRFAKDIHALSLNNKEAQEMVLIGNQGSPYIWLQFDKTEKPFKDFVLVDTGMHGIYNLSLDTYERLLKNQRIELLAKSKGASTISAFGLGEIKEQFLFHFPSFSIGNFTINNYIDNGTHNPSSRIGSKLLEYGSLTFDFINEKFYFDTKKDHIDLNDIVLPFFPTSLNKKMIVGIVWQEELKSKIQFGDQILEVDGRDLTKEDFCTLFFNPIFDRKKKEYKIKFKNHQDSIFTLNINSN